MSVCEYVVCEFVFVCARMCKGVQWCARLCKGVQGSHRPQSSLLPKMAA